LLILGKLSTPLFARTKISMFSDFFTPTQSPVQVAKALIQDLEKRKSGKIYRPYLARLAPLLKAMPDFVRNAVQWVSEKKMVANHGECATDISHFSRLEASGADEALQPKDD
jgi:hypothetical protein